MNIKFYEKNINRLFFSFLSYDIITDFVYFMYDAENNLRPWWFNIFCGTSLFHFLTKIHAFRYFCTIFLENKNYSKKKEICLLIISFFLALPRMIFYTYFSIKNNFSTEIISSLFRYEFEVYITYFSITIYPFILLFNPIKNLHEKLKTEDIPILIKKITKIFLYLGIIPRIFLDFIHTSTWKYLQNFLFETETQNFQLYSHSKTEFICILTTLYFFITYYFAKQLKKLLTISDERKKEFESIEEFKSEEFLIDIKSFNETSNQDFPVKSIAESSIKKTISKVLKIPTEYIHIDFRNEFEENLLLSKFKNNYEKEIVEEYIKEKSVTIFDEIDAYLYLTKNEDKNLLFIKNYLEKNNIESIFSWGNFEKIDGLVLIEKQKIMLNETDYDEENIEKIIYITEQLKILQRNFNQKKNFDILNFKSKTLESFANYITNMHENIISNINNAFFKFKSYLLIFQKKRIKWLSEEKPLYYEKIEELIEKKYYSEYIINDSKPIIHREKNNTLIINKTKDKKNELYSIFILPFSLVDFNEHKFVLTFTEVGEKINDLIPGYENTLCEYKNKLISILNDSRPNIIIYDHLKIDYVINIFKKIEEVELKKYSANEISDESFIKEIFTINFEENVEKFLKKIFIVINDFEKINSNLQRAILEEYIKKENEILKEKKIKLKIIFAISHIQDLTYLNSNLINVSMIYDLSSIKIKETLNDEREIFIKKICENILGIEISNEQASGAYSFLTSKTEDWTFYNFIEFLEDYFSEHKTESNFSIESCVQKAIILGKHSLRDYELMFSLAKIYKNNYSKIAKTLGIHKSSVSRFFKNYKQSIL